MTSFLDSHAHLVDPAFDADRELAVENARAAGAIGVVCIGESIAAAERAATLSAAHPGFVWFTAGVHPHDAADFDDTRDSAALRDLTRRGAVAVGECGLDYHYDHSPRLAQRRAFAAQLSARPRARSACRRPHPRGRRRHPCYDRWRRRSAGVRGVLHCYTGTAPLAEATLSAGWYVSFSGIVTFKKWDRDDVIRLVPADRLLVESDSPYLAPVPIPWSTKRTGVG